MGAGGGDYLFGDSKFTRCVNNVFIHLGLISAYVCQVVQNLSQSLPHQAKFYVIKN